MLPRGLTSTLPITASHLSNTIGPFPTNTLDQATPPMFDCVSFIFLSLIHALCCARTPSFHLFVLHLEQWTRVQDYLFLCGVCKHGYGNWTSLQADASLGLMPYWRAAVGANGEFPGVLLLTEHSLIPCLCFTQVLTQTRRVLRPC